MLARATVLSLLCGTYARSTTTTTTTMITSTMRNVAPPSSSHGSSKSFTVLTWNVLARDYTHYNKELPGCVQGHRNPNGSLETVNQTRMRHALASAAIIQRAPDAVLLQEFSVDFLSMYYNPLATVLLTHFVPAHMTNALGPGTGVLLRKAGPLLPSGPTLSVGGSKETGGTSKSASGVLVQLESEPERPVWLVSLHLTPYKYSPDKVCAHLRLLGEALRTLAENVTNTRPMAPPRVVIGGDLNAQPSEVRAIQSTCPTLGGAFYHVNAAGFTGLSADFSSAEYIDHFFLSSGLRMTGPVELERVPGSPYGISTDPLVSAPVIGASDHVWQSITAEP